MSKRKKALERTTRIERPATQPTRRTAGFRFVQFKHIAPLFKRSIRTIGQLELTNHRAVVGATNRKAVDDVIRVVARFVVSLISLPGIEFFPVA